MYRDTKLRKLMDMYTILESASSCEFSITKSPPQSNRMTKFGRKKALGEALTRKKKIKEDVSEEEFMNNMFDKFVASRGVQEGFADINPMRKNRFEGIDNKRIKDRFAKKFDIQYKLKKKTGHLISKWQGQ